METAGSPDNHIVGANGIPRRGMSSPWWPPLHLLRQPWGPNRLLLMAVRQSRWILMKLCNTDLKVNADKFHILRTLNTWRYLQVIDPRVTRHRHNHDLTAQKEVITRHFQDMVEHYRDHWARWNNCLPLSPWVWSERSNQIKGIKVYPNSGIRSIKEHSIM